MNFLACGNWVLLISGTGKSLVSLVDPDLAHTSAGLEKEVVQEVHLEVARRVKHVLARPGLARGATRYRPKTVVGRKWSGLTVVPLKLSGTTTRSVLASVWSSSGLMVLATSSMCPSSPAAMLATRS